MPDASQPKTSPEPGRSGSAGAGPQTQWGPPPPAANRRRPMKKLINLWAFPQGPNMSLAECFELAARAGFDAVELNYDLEGYLSPATSDREIAAIGQLARSLGIQISGICSLLQLSYPLTAADPARRARGLELTAAMIHAAGLLETENVLVIPGVVYIPWPQDFEPVPNDVCDRRVAKRWPN